MFSIIVDRTTIQIMYFYRWYVNLVVIERLMDFKLCKPKGNSLSGWLFESVHRVCFRNHTGTTVASDVSTARL